MKETLVSTLKESLLQIQEEEFNRYTKRHQAPIHLLNKGTDSFRERIFNLMCQGLTKIMDDSSSSQMEFIKPLLDYQGTIEQYRHSKKLSQ